MGVKWAMLFALLDFSIQNADAQAAMTISVFSASSKSIFFQWDKVTGATSYKITIALKDTPGQVLSFATFGENIVMGSINAGLTPNTNYVYTIEAFDVNGAVVGNGNGEKLTAPDRMDPIISVKPTDSTTLVMEFVPKSGASRYIIRVLNTQGFFRETQVTSSPAEITNLQPYTQYALSIMAANDGGRSQPTASVSSKTLMPPPHIQSSSPSNSSIDLSWAAIDSAVEYTVCLLKSTNTSERLTQNTSSTSLSFSGLDAGTLYLIEGFAWDVEGRKGQHSNETSQVTRPPTPKSVSASMMNNQLGLSVSWTMDPSVYGTLQYNVSSDHGQQCNTSALSCQLVPVSCGEVHSVEVTAENEAGPSVPSGAVVFTTIPCPPQNLALAETSPGSCTFSWDAVAHAHSYRAFIKNGAGVEEICNTTGTHCDFSCECGYFFLMSVFALNQAGSSQEGPALNYSTLPCCPASVNVSLISTDTLEIEWLASRGAEMYETRAVDNSETILCNDTSPVCALSYLNCDTPYTVKVTPCNDHSGCNRNCSAYTKDTAACMPTDLTLTKINCSAVTVGWTSTNRAATFIVTATGDSGVHSCSTTRTSCNITDLPCGTTYEIAVTATTAAGDSLPSYTEFYETEPCCPSSLSVDQVTQSMTNVSWSGAKGVHTFLTSLTSPKGYARCHTEDTHCIMGCITCGTSYNVTMEAYSLSGLQANCSYQGFSSSLCCPAGIKLYRNSPTSLRIYWRSTPGSSHSTEVDLTSVSNNYTCQADPGQSYCDLNNIQCGAEYGVVVSPIKPDGSTVKFCAQRKYDVSCSGLSVGTVLFRRKRSVE